MRYCTDKMYMYFNKESCENGEGERDPLTQQVIGCAIEVHRTLGPGLLESTYEKCLAHELKLAGLSFINQAALPIDYKGITVDCGYRLDVSIAVKMHTGERFENA